MYNLIQRPMNLNDSSLDKKIESKISGNLMPEIDTNFSWNNVSLNLIYLHLYVLAIGKT
jgi:hypothetical protein